MKIVVDEHIPLMTVKALREMGHEVRDIRGTSLEGMQDDDLWMLAQRHRCLLITTDRGFTRYRSSEHHGMLIVLLRQPNRHRIHQRILQGLNQFSKEAHTWVQLETTAIPFVPGHLLRTNPSLTPPSPLQTSAGYSPPSSPRFHRINLAS